MDDDALSTADLLRALGNEHRLTILEWLADPRSHFPEQRDGDLVDDGVCVGFITDKIGLSQPTVTNHLQCLAKVGIVNSKRIKNWAFYKLAPERLQQLEAALSKVAATASRIQKSP
ncbi:ArsR/SmtB family transcription factor [Manganibacter manganicus]|uniref:Transcriptional regulator n=1 Tax=Manganibacter manganicus TaxID=1873176 RepID=A0A1V8RRE4_9HYPH|nr:metalloregulator ArsR/SmtB family transcription factor [Pseudaminobacter manganicus]OQM75549.1 transcriptional regulator [Pseudaminobacter manganicus]